MQFTMNDVYSSIQKAANEVPIRMPASRLRFGPHSSKYKGCGPNFYQMVEYNPEDHDIDQIQWHLTDPDGTVYVREAIITKDFQVVVMADLSESMMYKLRLLFETIGNIGLTCSHAQDPMGFIGFSRDIIFDERPRVGEGTVYYLLERVYDFFDKMNQVDQEEKKPKLAGTDFKKALEFFSMRYAKSDCFLIVVSDFVGAEEFVKSQLLRDVSVCHEIVFLIPDDPSEFKINNWLGRLLGYRSNYLRMTDIESGKAISVSVKKMNQIEEEIRNRRKQMRNALRDMGIDSMVLEYSDKGKHYERLYRFFLNRQEMIRSGGN